MTSYRAIKSSLIVDKEVVRVDLPFVGLFQDLSQRKYLVNGRYSRSEATLIRPNQFIDNGLQSFTNYAGQDLICDVKETYTTVIRANCAISLFVYWAEYAKIPISRHAFFRPYFAYELVHVFKELITASLK